MLGPDRHEMGKTLFNLELIFDARVAKESMCVPPLRIFFDLECFKSCNFFFHLLKVLLHPFFLNLKLMIDLSYYKSRVTMD